MRLAESSPDVLLSASVVKMEDKKRPALNDHEMGAPPSKRQATLNGARKHPDAEMPWEKDIERYQKDAIYRQMNEYKREVKAQEAQLAELNKRATYHDDHLRTIDSWFDQLRDEMRVRIGELDKVGLDAQSKERIPSSVFFANHDNFQQHLTSRSQEINDFIAEIFSQLPTAHGPDNERLQQRISDLLASEKVHAIELERAQIERDQIQSRLESASLRYMKAEKKLDRMKSTIVAKMESQDQGSGVTGDPSAGSLDTSENSTGIAKNGDGAQNGSLDHADAVFEANMIRKETLGVQDKLKEQISSMTEDNDALRTQVTTLETKIATLSDEDFAKTEIYKQLKSQYEDVVKRANDLEARHGSAREELDRLQAERMAFKQQIETEMQAVTSEMESQLRRSDADLTRIRSARDELWAQLSVKERTGDTERASSAQFKELAASREARIKALESEAEKLRLELSKQVPDGTSGESLDDISHETLKQRYQNLQGQYEMLSAEVQSMGAAFQKAHALAAKKTSESMATDERIAKLQAERIKSDQKYFAAAKAKNDQDTQLRVLQVQNQKSSEIVSQLKEVESTTKQININLEKQLTETRASLIHSTGQSHQLQQQLNERSISVDGFKNQINELMANLQSKDQSLSVARKLQRESQTETERLRIRTTELEKLARDLRTRGSSINEAESESLRQIALCSICRNRFKDTALRLCGHVFCKDCIEERRSVRMRNCPTCTKAFGINDTMTVHL